ncbi:MAG: hypothetical protein AMS27_08080 [Bacteroides sp. SM23_62_1]|nr:MAG: hypothetical protein AMS27_08080 [Bacteroides sp. SM23_62_1]
MKRFKVILFLTILFIFGCKPDIRYQIIIPSEATGTEKLAAKEIRRYIYLTTDELIPIVQIDTPSQVINSIIISTKDQILLDNLDILPHSEYRNLKEQDFVMQSFTDGNMKGLFIIGGGPPGVLYGAYQLAEEMGIRFYLDGDIVPDIKQPLAIQDLNDRSGPLFELRGILPFHDFPEGPDWWNLDDYKAIIGQLPRMKMNFIGFHTYPENYLYPSGSYQAEPLVWIGPEQDVQADGTVTSAYPVLHFNTGDNTWGYNPMKTSDYHCGASSLFESDYFGADYMMNTSQWPRTPEENIRIFNDMGVLLKDAFSFARKLDVKTCIGTESPLTIPDYLMSRMNEDPTIKHGNIVKFLYKGIFQRIIKTHPLDYFWLWTPEGWTWSEVTREEVLNTEKDLLWALEAAEEDSVPFSLATCGWVLGPPGDRTKYDQILPVEIPFSCINREVGFSSVEPSFADLTDRSGWAIPWLEDDPALVSPQLWAGRMRKDASDALQYNCDGLMGIHWRTKILGPNISALAQAAWRQSGWSDVPADSSSRDMPVTDFYLDWAESKFGTEIPDKIARIFIHLDGGPLYDRVKNPERQANLYRTSDWQGGPGGIIITRQSWDTVQQNFAFIDSLLALKPMISGTGNLERFDYWLNTFLFAKESAHFGCIMGLIDSMVFRMKDEVRELQIKEFMELNIIPLRIQAARVWEEMMFYLLQTVSTTGDLGTIANLEQHNLGLLQVLNKYDSLVIAGSGRPLPPEAEISMKYSGPLRIIVPTRRNLLEAGENLNLKVILLCREPVNEAYFSWRYLGDKKFTRLPLIHLNRSVYKVVLSPGMIGGRDFEYYIEAESVSGEKTYFPVTAPGINQTIVVMSDFLE